MEKFFITFGQGHPWKKKVICIQAPNEHLARDAVHQVIGKNWAFIYAFDNLEHGFAKQCADYGYTVLSCFLVTEKKGTEDFYVDEIDQRDFQVK
ncbi:MAG: hypothetical protein ACUZ8E_18065 [Candidatus Anammoxibacter sp.]